MYGRKLSPKRVSNLISPLLTALIALRLGRCREEHFYDLLGHIMIAGRIAELVPRHRHTLKEIREATTLLGVIFERWAKRTIEDAFVSGKPEEVDAIETAVKIYEALLKTTPLSTVRKAMLNVSDLTRPK